MESIHGLELAKNYFTKGIELSEDDIKKVVFDGGINGINRL